MKMRVMHVTSECAPWAKTGGLGDVVGALPSALQRADDRVESAVVSWFGAHTCDERRIPESCPRGRDDFGTDLRVRLDDPGHLDVHARQQPRVGDPSEQVGEAVPVRSTGLFRWHEDRSDPGRSPAGAEQVERWFLDHRHGTRRY